MNDDMLIVVYFIIGILILWGIMGFVTKTISNNKGYDGGFWWGFLLGIFGIIIVACKPVNPNPTVEYSSDKKKRQKQRYKERQRRIKQKQKNNLFK